MKTVSKGFYKSLINYVYTRPFYSLKRADRSTLESLLKKKVFSEELGMDSYITHVVWGNFIR